MDIFQHRGDFKASRKSEVFQPIIPLTPADIARSSIEDMGFCDLIASVQKMREELKLTIAELSPRSNTSDLQTALAP
jgi:hypothetical protein